MTVAEYINNQPAERKEALLKLQKCILSNLPKGFEETIGYNMPSYVVPHSLYPKGYHCDTKLPLPFMSFASQKNSINFYHMGIYADKELYNWFVSEYPKYSKLKLDMGKSCIRFKKIEQIPFELLGELVQKMTVDQWINLYEQNFLK
jgi:uncharacterized protein YdhG (YjbR/CyaY superfamily)